MIFDLLFLIVLDTALEWESQIVRGVLCQPFFSIICVMQLYTDDYNAAFLTAWTLAEIPSYAIGEPDQASAASASKTMFACAYAGGWVAMMIGTCGSPAIFTCIASAASGVIYLGVLSLV